MLGLKCLFNGVLLWDVAHGGVLTPNAMLTLYILESLGCFLGERHSLEDLS